MYVSLNILIDCAVVIIHGHVHSKVCKCKLMFIKHHV